MSGNFDTRRNRSRSPSNDYAKRSLLAKIDKSKLTEVKVAIKIGGITRKGPNVPIQRSVDDPVRICAYVHVRKGNPPRIPIFGRDIKVNQDFSEDRTVFTRERHSRPSRRSRSRSRSRSDRYRSRSRDRSRNESKRSQSRYRSRSRDRRDRSRGRTRKRSSSRTRRSISRYRSRSRERRYSPERRRYRDDSRERRRRTKSRSLSPSEHKPSCPNYRPPERHRRRSITPLRPGEYRPGHPDLVLRNTSRKSRSKSPRDSSRSRRTPSPYNRDRRRSRSRHRSPSMKMPRMEYGFFEGYTPLPMNPFRGRFPMVDPGFYPRMFAPNMMVPRMPLNPMMARMPPFRHRWPIYNSGAVGKSIAPKPATITSNEDEGGVIIEQAEDTENDAVSSSDKPGVRESAANSSDVADKTSSDVVKT